MKNSSKGRRAAEAEVHKMQAELMALARIVRQRLPVLRKSAPERAQDLVGLVASARRLARGNEFGASRDTMHACYTIIGSDGIGDRPGTGCAAHVQNSCAAPPAPNSVRQKKIDTTQQAPRTWAPLSFRVYR